MTAIVECIQNACMSGSGSGDNPLLFVGLQELTPQLINYLKPLFNQIGYQFHTQDISPGQYGVGVAVPAGLEIVEKRFIPFTNSLQGRGLYYVRTPTLLFGTTHLESWCGRDYTGAKEREAQIIEATRFCERQFDTSHGGESPLRLAVILGDLNWDDERKQKPNETPNRNLLSILPSEWKDAGKKFDFTYDAKENPMLGGSLRRRFDRCLFYSPSKATGNNKRWKFESVGLQKIGKEAIPNLVWNKRNMYNGSVKQTQVTPSDHFGIVVSFREE